jgi:hypothetical protein
MESREKLEYTIHQVKMALSWVGIDAPFFIAGGAVYSMLVGNTQYDDIDVFFYNREDCERVTKNHEWQSKAAMDTENALTMVFQGMQKKVQFIKLHVGSIPEVFKSFDINCSKCAFTSNLQLHYDLDLADPIDVNLMSINGLVVDRYYKYTVRKKALDPKLSTLKKLIRHFAGNHAKNFGESYHSKDGTTGIGLLESVLGYAQPGEITQFIHDSIAEQPVNTRIEIFNSLNQLCNYNIPNVCDEYRLASLLARSNDIVPASYAKDLDDDDKRVMEKYAEYFI